MKTSFGLHRMTFGIGWCENAISRKYSAPSVLSSTQKKSAFVRFGRLLPIMATRRKQLWLDGDKRCCWCKRPIASWHESTIEHFIPRSVGGRNTSTNLGCACKKCNSAKGSVACYPEDYPIIFSTQYSLVWNPLVAPAPRQERVKRPIVPQPKKVRRKQRRGGGLGCKAKQVLYVD